MICYLTIFYRKVNRTRISESSTDYGKFCSWMYFISYFSVSILSCLFDPYTLCWPSTMTLLYEIYVYYIYYYYCYHYYFSEIVMRFFTFGTHRLKASELSITITDMFYSYIHEHFHLHSHLYVVQISVHTNGW